MGINKERGLNSKGEKKYLRKKQLKNSKASLFSSRGKQNFKVGAKYDIWP